MTGSKYNMNWIAKAFKPLVADVRSAVVSMLVTSGILILAPVLATIFKGYWSEPVPWTIFIIVVCVGIVLLFVAIRLTNRLPLLADEEPRESLKRYHGVADLRVGPTRAVSGQIAARDKWPRWTDSRYKRIKDCIRNAAQLLRDDGKGAKELWPFNAICRSGADQLHDNSEVAEVCEVLVARGGWDHPFNGLENHVLQSEWLEFIQAATHRSVCLEMAADYLLLAAQWPLKKGRPEPTKSIPRKLVMLGHVLRSQGIGREQGSKSCSA